jgi:ERCC4-type nuclease
MRIHIDHREQAPALEAELHRQGIRLYRIRLSLGDYRIDNRLLFERKTLTDLRLSLRDGRLFDQARRLYHWAAHHPGRRVALILEGRVRPPLTPAWERRLIQGALLKLSLFWGIPVFRALCQEESARLMLYAARQYSRGAMQPSRMPICHTNFTAGAVDKPRVQQQLLLTLPGIGQRRASALLERFGSLGGIVRADESQLAAVDRIGPVLARRIKWLVSESGGNYRV